MARLVAVNPRPNIIYRAGILLVASLLLPPLLLMEAWKTRSQRYRHWVLTLFFTIYGATITIAFDPLGFGPDGVRHLLSVYTHYEGLSFWEYFIQLREILTFQLTEAPKEDVFIHTLSYVLGGVLGVPWLFWPVVATVYGYFFTGSMLIIFRDFGQLKLPLVIIIISATFFLMLNLQAVNTVRTWTGLWVLVYGFLMYHETRRKRYLILLACPPLIHFGYFVMALPAYAVLVLGIRPVLYSVLFFTTSFATIINPGQITAVIEQTELGQQRLSGYYTEERPGVADAVSEQLDSGGRIWNRLRLAGVQKWALILLVGTVILTGIYGGAMNLLQNRVFSAGLLALTLSNSTWFIYALSNRSWVVGAVFCLSAFLMWRFSLCAACNLFPRGQNYKIGVSLSAVIFIPYLVYLFSFWMDFPSVYLVALPIVPWLAPELNISIKEFLQILLIEMLKIL